MDYWAKWNSSPSNLLRAPPSQTVPAYRRSLASRPSRQCVITKCTPVVHIKIAGIYGCSSHSKWYYNRYWPIAISKFVGAFFIFKILHLKSLASRKTSHVVVAGPEPEATPRPSHKIVMPRLLLKFMVFIGICPWKYIMKIMKGWFADSHSLRWFRTNFLQSSEAETPWQSSAPGILTGQGARDHQHFANFAIVERMARCLIHTY